METLVELKIDFNNNKLTNKGIEMITKSISNMKKLLYLGFGM